MLVFKGMDWTSMSVACNKNAECTCFSLELQREPNLGNRALLLRRLPRRLRSAVFVKENSPELSKKTFLHDFFQTSRELSSILCFVQLKSVSVVLHTILTTQNECGHKKHVPIIFSTIVMMVECSGFRTSKTFVQFSSTTSPGWNEGGSGGRWVMPGPHRDQSRTMSLWLIDRRLKI